MGFCWAFVEILAHRLGILLPSLSINHLFLISLISSFSYASASLKIIPEGNEGIVERFGRFHRRLKTGVNFIIPILDNVLEVTTRERFLGISHQAAITRDNISVYLDLVIYWKTLDVLKAHYAVEGLEKAIEALVVTSVRSEIGQLNLTETFSSRNQINRAILLVLDDATESWGVKVIRVELQGIELSQALKDALEAERAAESLKRATMLEVETKKQAAILEAEIRSSVAIQDAGTEIEIARLRTQALRSGVLLDREEEEKLREEVKDKIKEEYEKIIFNPVFNVSQLSEMQSHMKSESKAMNHSTEEHRNVNAGRDLNLSNSTLNLGNISGVVTNAISQLPSDPPSKQPGVKEILTQLQQAIEAETELQAEDKADLLEQVKTFAEAQQISEKDEKEGLVRKAKKIFDATLRGLPDTAKIVEACSKLLPMLFKALGLPV